MNDLIVLAACSQIEHSIAGILTRTESLGMRPIAHEIITHPHKDPGCYLSSHDLLRAQTRRFTHALVVFDHEGSGQDQVAAGVLETDVEGRLTASGWGSRAAAVVIDPELEVWVFSDSPAVDQITRWNNQPQSMRQWLAAQGFTFNQHGKPDRPKDAFEAALKKVKLQRSSAIFRELACNVSTRRCTDRAFRKLATFLAANFPA